MVCPLSIRVLRARTDTTMFGLGMYKFFDFSMVWSLSIRVLSPNLCAFDHAPVSRFLIPGCVLCQSGFEFISFLCERRQVAFDSGTLDMFTRSKSFASTSERLVV